MNLQAIVVSVTDGDTLSVAFAQPVPVRVADVDAPEVNTAAGEAAKAYLTALFPVGSPVDVEIRSEDPYGRVVAHVGADAGRRLVHDGHARRWTRTTTT